MKSLGKFARIPAVALALPVLFAAAGCCTGKIAVASLESTIRDAALAAKKAGADDLTMEVSATTAVKAGVEVPISVVAIGAEATLSQATKVTVSIKKLADYPDVLVESQVPERFLLDPRTGQLQPIKPK